MNACRRTAARSSSNWGCIPWAIAHWPKASASSGGLPATPLSVRCAGPGPPPEGGDGQRLPWPLSARSSRQVPKRRRHSPAGASQLRHQRRLIGRERRYVVPHCGQVHRSPCLCAAGSGNGQFNPAHARTLRSSQMARRGGQPAGPADRMRRVWPGYGAGLLSTSPGRQRHHLARLTRCSHCADHCEVVKLGHFLCRQFSGVTAAFAAYTWNK